MGEAKKQREEVPEFYSFFAQLAPYRRVLITRTGIAEKAGKSFEFYRIRGYTPKDYSALASNLEGELTTSFANETNPNVNSLSLMRNVPIPRKVRDYQYRHRIMGYSSREEWAVKHGLAVVIPARKKSEDEKKK